jgi:hypothetical protein
VETLVGRFAAGGVVVWLGERGADEEGHTWRQRMHPNLNPVELDWATFQAMRRTFATRSKAVGVDAHTRSAQMGNTVDVNENEYAMASFEQKLAAARKLESVVIRRRRRELSNVEAFLN